MSESTPKSKDNMPNWSNQAPPSPNTLQLNKPPDFDEEFYSPHEVAYILKISYRKVLEAINNGILEAHRFIREYRITRTQLEKYLRITKMRQNNTILSGRM